MNAPSILMIKSTINIFFSEHEQLFKSQHPNSINMESTIIDLEVPQGKYLIYQISYFITRFDCLKCIYWLILNMKMNRLEILR